MPEEVRESVRQGLTPLRAWRRYLRQAPETLARRADLPLEVLTELEAGERRPDLQQLRSLSWSLGVPIDDLIDGPDER